MHMCHPQGAGLSVQLWRVSLQPQARVVSSSRCGQGARASSAQHSLSRVSPLLLQAGGLVLPRFPTFTTSVGQPSRRSGRQSTSSPPAVPALSWRGPQAPSLGAQGRSTALLEAQSPSPASSSPPEVLGRASLPWGPPPWLRVSRITLRASEKPHCPCPVQPS